MKIILFAAIFLIFPLHAEVITSGAFSDQSLSAWEEKEFEGKTDYKFIRDDGKFILKAQTNRAASGLFKKIRIDLNKTPYINWSWKTESLLIGLNERSRQGDDYVARVYLVKENDFFFWKTKALNYVWSSNQNKDSSWDNAYTSQAKMLAIRGKESKTNQWYYEKRNVKEDFKRLFGEDINTIDVIAIMSDTDNSKLSATSFYGDIFFSSE